jgi:23S rRNA (guanosine2251-2'-O)-methyltransferase
VKLSIPGEGVRYFYRINQYKLKEKISQYIFGIRPIAEAISAGREINKVFIRKNLRGGLFAELFQTIREMGIPFQFVPSEKLNNMVRGNHQGIIAQLSLIDYKNLEEVVQRTFEQGRDPLIVILDQITDVRNFGAIARTAECAGVDVIVVPEKNSALITPDAIKTSAGALNRIAVNRKKDLTAAVTYLKESGIEIIAATEKAHDPYYTADLRGPLAIIMGSEEYGITPSLLKLADRKVTIPLAGSIESLNVSVALGIIIFDVLRQRSQSV